MIRILTILLFTASLAQGQSVGFNDYLITGNPGWNGLHSGSGYPVPVRIFFPPDAIDVINGNYHQYAEKGKKFPMIFHYHGIGERSDTKTPRSAMTTADLGDLTATSPAAYLQNSSGALWNLRYAAPGRTDSTQFIYVFPQSYGGSGGSASDAEGYFYLIYFSEPYDYIKENFSSIADFDRLYAAGLSYGGGAVLTMMQDSIFCSRTAAAVAVCAMNNTYTGFRPTGVEYGAAYNFGTIARQRLPMFIFQAVDDDVLPTQCTIHGISSTRACIAERSIDSINKYKPAQAPIYLRYSTGKHQIWDRIWNPGYRNTEWPLQNGNSSAFLKTYRMQDQLLQYTISGRKREF